MSQLMPIPEVAGVFTEAFLLDDHSETVFISFIGKDIAIQAFRASWSIPASQGGLTDFLVETQHGTPRIHLGNPENMEFQSGRLSTNLFGELVQVWVFKHLAQKPDYANRKAIQLYRLDEDKVATQDNLWALVKDLSHLPLLDEWRPVIVDLLIQKDWIKHWKGVGGIAAHYIHLPEEEMELLYEVLKEIKPDRIDLGTIDRPPAYRVFPVSYEKLYELSKVFKGLNVMVVGRKENENRKYKLGKEEIIRTLRIRPMPENDILSLFDRETTRIYKSLLKEGILKEKEIANVKFIYA